MLKKIRARASFHWQAALHSLRLLISKPIASTMTILVIAITLSLPVLFLMFTSNLSKLTTEWQHGGQISLYLSDALEAEEQASLLTKVEAMPGVGHATLKTPEEGLHELQAQEGMQDIMRYLPENPLPAVIEVIPAISIDTPQKMEQLYGELKDIPEVAEAKLDVQWINRLHAILGFAAKITNALIVLLALAVLLIVGNTLRLAIQSRHEEIQVLKLIGATDAFIVRPFLYSGIWYGLGGALLALVLVDVFLYAIAFAANKLASVYEMHYDLSGLSLPQTLILIAVATGLGFLGARLSVKRQLSSIEP